MAIQKKKKIIAYRIRTDEEIHFQEGQGFIIAWEVGWQLKIGDKIRFHSQEPVDEPGVFLCTQRPMSLDGEDDKDVKFLEWTQERQDFFEGLTKAINELKAKTKKFLNDPEMLSKFIESKGQLFLTDGKEGE